MSPDEIPEVTASQRVFEGRLVDVRVDHIRFADGSGGRREVIDHPGAVVIAALDENGRVALARQYRHPVRAYLVELPAGTLEEGESPRDTAERELKEEAGLSARKWASVGSFYSSPGFLREELHAFLARDLEHDVQQLEEDEDIELRWRSLDDLLTEGDGIHDAKTLATLMLVRARLAAEARTAAAQGRVNEQGAG